MLLIIHFKLFILEYKIINLLLNKNVIQRMLLNIRCVIFLIYYHISLELVHNILFNVPL